MTILRSRASRYALDDAAEHDVPVFVLHGSWDLAVPHRTARDTARRTDGVLVTIEHAGHSWILRDPETLPAIVAELLAAELGDGIRSSLRAAGVAAAGIRRSTTSSGVCYRPGRAGLRPRRRPTLGARSSVGTAGPRYRWRTER